MGNTYGKIVFSLCLSWRLWSSISHRDCLCPQPPGGRRSARTAAQRSARTAAQRSVGRPGQRSGPSSEGWLVRATAVARDWASPQNDNMLYILNTSDSQWIIFSGQHRGTSFCCKQIPNWNMCLLFLIKNNVLCGIYAIKI